MNKSVLGLIDDSSVYDHPSFESARLERFRNAWGEPFDAMLRIGEFLACRSCSRRARTRSVAYFHSISTIARISSATLAET